MGERSLQIERDAFQVIQPPVSHGTAGPFRCKRPLTFESAEGSDYEGA